jgi:hypothetical protein
MSKLNKLTKVSDSYTINRYDNGWMVEVSGNDDEDDWVSSKVICNTEEELIEIVKEYNTKTLRD